MLRLACALYLRNARAGADGRHRRRCRGCDAYLSRLEVVAPRPADLPADLSRKLQEIPEIASSIPRLPSSPLPLSLRRRLAEILPPSQPQLPRFVGSPVYSVAAAYAAALVVAAVWGNPYNIIQPTLDNVQSSAEAVLAETSDAVSTWVRDARLEVGQRSDRAERIGGEILEKLGVGFTPSEKEGTEP